MKVESLEELRAAFAEWRRKKKHPREAVPEELLVRARRVAKTQGTQPVVRALKVDRRRLEGTRTRVEGEGGPGRARVPSYTRVELSPSVADAGPFAELELPSGLRVRLYSQTPEAMGLLSSVCGGGER